MPYEGLRRLRLEKPGAGIGVEAWHTEVVVAAVVGRDTIAAWAACAEDIPEEGHTVVDMDGIAHMDYGRASVSEAESGGNTAALLAYAQAYKGPAS